MTSTTCPACTNAAFPRRAGISINDISRAPHRRTAIEIDVGRVAPLLAAWPRARRQQGGETREKTKALTHPCRPPGRLGNLSVLSSHDASGGLPQGCDSK